MNYLLAANIIAVIHGILVIGVFLGILVSVRYKKFRPVETFILLSAIVIWSLYDGCPLTYLEHYLRNSAGVSSAVLETGFIPHYFNYWFGTSFDARQLTIATYTTVAIFFAVSVEWMSPFINMEIVKLRRVFKSRK